MCYLGQAKNNQTTTTKKNPSRIKIRVFPGHQLFGGHIFVDLPYWVHCLEGRMKEINALKVVSEVFQMEKLLRGLWDHRFASYPFKIHRVYQFQVNLFQSRFGTITFANMQKSNLKKWSFKIIGHFQLCKNILVGKIFFAKPKKIKDFQMYIKSEGSRSFSLTSLL